MKRYFHKDFSRPPYITVPEYRAARLQLLRHSQKHTYGKEYELLEQKKLLPKSSPLSPLSPFLDDQGIMRVGGRLQKAGLNPAVAHPTILGVKSHIVDLLLEHTYRTLRHAGPSTVMATLAYQYHIPTIKKRLRKMSRACVTCRKAYARTSKQQMGELPEVRTQIARPFSIIGMDFAGPFPIK